MIRRCEQKDLEEVYEVINDAASAYKGIIPADRWKEPYMPLEELNHEIKAGIVFWCLEEGDIILGVMGLQDMGDVTLIRHAYVRTSRQRQGIGSRLLNHLRKQTDKPILMGTWKDATWAIFFYEKHGFALVTEEEKNLLLRKYWSIPERQVETSVVLADDKWIKR